jgi:CheY-like chemotaxis protein
MKILVVDDDAITRFILKTILEKNGYTAQTASNGFMALQQCKLCNFDFVLLDLHMPGLSGLGTAYELKMNAEYSFNGKIIAITGDDDFKNDLFDEILHKPIFANILLDTLKGHTFP